MSSQIERLRTNRVKSAQRVWEHFHIYEHRGKAHGTLSWMESRRQAAWEAAQSTDARGASSDTLATHREEEPATQEGDSEQCWRDGRLGVALTCIDQSDTGPALSTQQVPGIRDGTTPENLEVLPVYREKTPSLFKQTPHRTPDMQAEGLVRVALALAVSLVLLPVGAADNCSVSVSQPPTLEVDQAQAAVTVPCSFSRRGCQSQRARSLWFRVGAQQPEALCLQGCTGEEDKFMVQEAPAQGQVSLTIRRPTPNDSAIYVCGIAVPSEDPRAKRTGAGTVLVVREKKGHGEELYGLLIALVSLLSLYVAAVFVIFIILSRSKANTRGNKETEDSQKKSVRRVFRDIAQELYSKRYVGTSRQPEKGNTYGNRRALDKYERPQKWIHGQLRH
ncbi:immunoglobulin superfamily member 6 [Rhynchonycteris naso]